MVCLHLEHVLIQLGLIFPKYGIEMLGLDLCWHMHFIVVQRMSIASLTSPFSRAISTSIFSANASLILLIL